MLLLFYNVLGMASQTLSYVGEQLVLNYTGGETCHRIYQRSTAIYFSCHPKMNPVSLSEAKEETSNATSLLVPKCAWMW